MNIRQPFDPEFLPCEKYVVLTQRYVIFFTTTVFAILSLVACKTASRQEIATSLAGSSFMFPRQIPANPFVLTLYERVEDPGRSITIYIEGDGLAWTEHKTPSPDPTPTNPIALRLATTDNSPNIIYLARPCQYSKMVIADRPCPQKYWTSHRFAPQVIESMNTALEDLKTRYQATGFHLIGFSGGGAVGTLLAARRHDVFSLRTVAGNLDHKLLHKIHEVTQLSSSLNPVDIASQISHIPQHHFLGEDDAVISDAVVKSFLTASGTTRCIRTSMVPGASHEQGWTEQWPRLLAAPLTCQP